MVMQVYKYFAKYIGIKIHKRKVHPRRNRSIDFINKRTTVTYLLTAFLCRKKMNVCYYYNVFDC